MAEDMDPAGIAPVTARRSVSEEVVERLLELIAAGSAPTQRLLPEHVLCERLGVGRSALREALSALGHLGIVEIRGKTRMASTVAARTQLLRRAAAGPGALEEVAHALEARRLLEPPMAALAAERATPEALERIAHFLELLEGGDDPELLIEYDSGFHVLIARATGNPTLVHMVSAIADALASTRRASLHAPGGVSTSNAGHRAIMAALEAHDGDAARVAMERHLDDVSSLIELGLEPGTEHSSPP